MFVIVCRPLMSTEKLILNLNRDNYKTKVCSCVNLKLNGTFTAAMKSVRIIVLFIVIA